MYTIKEREHARRITDVPTDAWRLGVRYRPGCRYGWQRRPVRPMRVPLGRSSSTKDDELD